MYGEIEVLNMQSYHSKYTWYTFIINMECAQFTYFVIMVNIFHAQIMINMLSDHSDNMAGCQVIGQVKKIGK